nr:hypothetical protein [Tanacetum cinerariifolium]GEW63525.1 hypothetical protein [Tanacetum cinerariifolium]
MKYLEEQMDGEEMINSIKMGDQPLPRVTQVSIARTSSTEQPPLKDNSMWSDQEKKIQKIDRFARSLLIQEHPNDIYSSMIATKLPKTYGMLLQGESLLDTYIRYLQVITDLKRCGYSKDNCDVNDAMKPKKKVVVITFDPLALVAEQTKPTNNNLRTSSATSSANKKQEYVKSDDKKEEKKVDEKKRDMSKFKCYNCKKEGHFAKDWKKAKVKDYEYYKTKMLLAKRDKDEQVLLAEDYAWMESSSDSDQEINANMVFMAQMKKVLSDSEKSSSSSDETIVEVSYCTSESESESEFETSKYYDNSTNYGLFMDNGDDQEIFHDSSKSFSKNHIRSQMDYDQSAVDHNDLKKRFS